MREMLLEIHDLRTHFYTEDGVVKAINGVNLEIARGETLGLVGESGSGKSVTALSILRLIQDPPGKIVSGQVLYNGEDLLTYPMARLRREIRGREIAMIFQDPMISLNPVFTVGNQLAEAIYLHQFKGQRGGLTLGRGKATRGGRAPGLEGVAEAGTTPYARTLWRARRAARCADDGGGRHSLGQGPGDRLPASVLGGDAATHYDRHGDLLQSCLAHRR